MLLVIFGEDQLKKKEKAKWYNRLISDFNFFRRSVAYATKDKLPKEKCVYVYLLIPISYQMVAHYAYDLCVPATIRWWTTLIKYKSNDKRHPDLWSRRVWSERFYVIFLSFVFDWEKKRKTVNTRGSNAKRKKTGKISTKYETNLRQRKLINKRTDLSNKKKRATALSRCWCVQHKARLEFIEVRNAWSGLSAIPSIW